MGINIQPQLVIAGFCLTINSMCHLPGDPNVLPPRWALRGCMPKKPNRRMARSWEKIPENIRTLPLNLQKPRLLSCKDMSETTNPLKMKTTRVPMVGECALVSVKKFWSLSIIVVMAHDYLKKDVVPSYRSYGISSYLFQSRLGSMFCCNIASSTY